MNSPIGRVVVTSMVVTLGLLMAPMDATAHGKKAKRLTGGLTTEQVLCDTLCTHGPLTGGLEGTLEFRMDSMEETGNPDVVRYVGVNTITTSHGTLSGTDYGLWNLATGEFIDYTMWEDGSGAYAGARGHLVIIGAFDPVTGTGSSRYHAIVH